MITENIFSFSRHCESNKNVLRMKIFLSSRSNSNIIERNARQDYSEAEVEFFISWHRFHLRSVIVSNCFYYLVRLSPELKLCFLIFRIIGSVSENKWDYKRHSWILTPPCLILTQSIINHSFQPRRRHETALALLDSRAKWRLTTMVMMLCATNYVALRWGDQKINKQQKWNDEAGSSICVSNLFFN